ncbi:MAG TPA: EAL domain-containing protein [Burkholderiales bacterium]|nr:EAL domain-containing protein [Burkholderiales bacterium]
MDEQFLERMDSQLAGWSDPVERLRRALDNDEFQLYCQPILALQEGDYPIAEILVRLREEERALVPPGEFLPVFEHFRMMPQLDRWVVRHTLKRLAAGSRIRHFTINVSGQTLEDAEFPRFVAGQLKTSNVASDAIGFEVDEGDALQRPRAAKQFAEACRAIGAPVLLDGFGRLSVSFTPIKDLRVQFVKVDGAISRKLLASEGARGKLGAILRVSEALGFAVVAECVEEQEVLARLKAMGVRYAQGFGVSPPHAIDAMAQPA